MPKLYFIGYAAQPGGVSLPVYGDAPCSCTVLKCPVGCVCECHHERALIATIKAILTHAEQPVTTDDIVLAFRIAAIRLPDDPILARDLIRRLRKDAEGELAREKGGK